MPGKKARGETQAEQNTETPKATKIVDGEGAGEEESPKYSGPPVCRILADLFRTVAYEESDVSFNVLF